MAEGIPYDSPEGRAYAGAITSLMCGEAYLPVGARRRGPRDRSPVRRQPRADARGDRACTATPPIASRRAAVPLELRRAATDSGTPRSSRQAVRLPQRAGHGAGAHRDHRLHDGLRHHRHRARPRARQVQAAGGRRHAARSSTRRCRGPSTASATTRRAGPNPQAPRGHRHDRGRPGPQGRASAGLRLRLQGRSSGTRFISALGHLRMMGAVQPFLSGAISKTVNVPERHAIRRRSRSSTSRRGSWASRRWRSTATTARARSRSPPRAQAGVATFQPVRRKLPDERVAMTHKFSVEGHEGYVTVGLYEDGKPGELFITMAKEGSTLSGVMDAFATAISLTLQYGVPLEFLVNKFSHVRFEPRAGPTTPRSPTRSRSSTTSSAGWPRSSCRPRSRRQSAFSRYPATRAGRRRSRAAAAVAAGARALEGAQLFVNQADAPPCPTCGMMMVRSGSCYKCGNCGTVHGCS